MLLTRFAALLAAAALLFLLAPAQAGSTRRAQSPQYRLNLYVWRYYPGLRQYVNWNGGGTFWPYDDGSCCVFVHAGIGLVGGHVEVRGGQQQIVGLHAEVYTKLRYDRSSHPVARRLCLAVWAGLSHLRIQGVTTIEVFSRTRSDAPVDNQRLERYPCR